MKHDEMMGYLQGLGVESRLPVWSFSYNRAGSAPFLESMRSWQYQEEIHVVVRASQVADYQAAYPWAHIYPVADEVDCVGHSRQTALDLAAILGHDEVVLVDDDLTNVGFLFEGAIKSGKNAGQPCSTRSSKADREALGSLPEYVLAGISDVTRSVVAAHPKAVLGGGVKQHGAFGAQLHPTKYRVNGGVTPKQLMTVSPRRLADAGVRLNVDLFGRHGDDIGLIAEILANGLACWAMPSFTYDVWSEDANILKSVVRNPATAAALHAEEWDALQQYPIKDYLRTKRSIVDGSFEWADVNWQKYAKVTGVQPSTTLWAPDEERAMLG